MVNITGAGNARLGNIRKHLDIWMIWKMHFPFVACSDYCKYANVSLQFHHNSGRDNCSAAVQQARTLGVYN